MNKQVHGQEERTQRSCQASVFAYLAAGVGISAALSVLFAPKSGEEARKWVANKCFDVIDAANEKVRESRVHAKDIMDRGQQQISEAVAAGRESFGKHEAAESPVTL
jgi:gas vesicle protein